MQPGAHRLSAMLCITAPIDDITFVPIAAWPLAAVLWPDLLDCKTCPWTTYGKSVPKSKFIKLQIYSKIWTEKPVKI